MILYKKYLRKLLCLIYLSSSVKDEADRKISRIFLPIKTSVCNHLCVAPNRNGNQGPFRAVNFTPEVCSLSDYFIQRHPQIFQTVRLHGRLQKLFFFMSSQCRNHIFFFSKKRVENTHLISKLSLTGIS